MDKKASSARSPPSSGNTPSKRPAAGSAGTAGSGAGTAQQPLRGPSNGGASSRPSTSSSKQAKRFPLPSRLQAALVVAALVAAAAYWLVGGGGGSGGGRGYSSKWSAWDGPVRVDDVLTAEDCRYIMSLADPIFDRSMNIGPDGVRTSETAWIDKTDPVARKVFNRALELLADGRTLDNCENLQVVRYREGTFFAPHHDSCCEGTDGCRMFAEDGGQRVGTLIIYLNENFTDGETMFPAYKGGVKLKATPGNGIFFKPLGADGKCHPLALHEGRPVSSGVKYMCNAWIREKTARTF